MDQRQRSLEFVRNIRDEIGFQFSQGHLAADNPREIPHRRQQRRHRKRGQRDVDPRLGDQRLTLLFHERRGGANDPVPQRSGECLVPNRLRPIRGRNLEPSVSRNQGSDDVGERHVRQDGQPGNVRPGRRVGEIEHRHDYRAISNPLVRKLRAQRYPQSQRDGRAGLEPDPKNLQRFVERFGRRRQRPQSLSIPNHARVHPRGRFDLAGTRSLSPDGESFHGCVQRGLHLGVHGIDGLGGDLTSSLLVLSEKPVRPGPNLLDRQDVPDDRQPDRQEHDPKGKPPPMVRPTGT